MLVVTGLREGVLDEFLRGHVVGHDHNADGAALLVVKGHGLGVPVGLVRQAGILLRLMRSTSRSCT